MKAATMEVVESSDCSESILALLRHRADVFVRDQRGKTALEWARLTNNTVACRHIELAIQSHIYTRRCTEADEDMVKKHADVLKRHDQLSSAMLSAIASAKSLQVGHCNA